MCILVTLSVICLFCGCDCLNNYRYCFILAVDKQKDKKMEIKEIMKLKTETENNIKKELDALIELIKNDVSDMEVNIELKQHDLISLGFVAESNVSIKILL